MYLFFKIFNRVIFMLSCLYLANLGLNLSLTECFLIEIILYLVLILFSFFLGINGVFILFFGSNLFMFVKLWSMFDHFNNFSYTFLVDFGTNTHTSLVYKNEFGITIDAVSFNFSFLTLLIATFVSIYAFSYMRNEPKIILFIIFLKGFVLSMIILLWASNWFTFVLGWELIGITSFFLINFWTSKITTLKSAFKAFTFNKLSDGCLILSVLLSYTWGLDSFFNNNLQELINSNKQIFLLGFELPFNDVLLFLLIICSFCKSAQFGFHSWLPDSMEAPVPASALIHSATLVSAGIYLIFRYIPLLMSSNLLPIFIFITSFTAFYGAIISSFQTDVKKILAYSTISHCGFLMFSLILNNPYVTIFYLYGHGLFKSLSFMGVGNLIQYSNNYQDSRRMGNLFAKYVYEFFFLIVCLLNLSSFPFFLNFFSKHFLFNSLILNNYVSLISYIFLFFASYAGVFYSLRIIYFSFLTFKKGHYSFYKIFYTEVVLNRKNSNKLSLLVTIILYILSCFILMKFIGIFMGEYSFFIDLFTVSTTPNSWLSSLQTLYIRIFFLYVIFFLNLAFGLFKSNKSDIMSKCLFLFLFLFFVEMFIGIYIKYNYIYFISIIHLF